MIKTVSFKKTNHKESYPEKCIRELLEERDIYFVQEKTFNNLRGESNCKLRFDFYLPNHRTVIEYDGEHHYKPIYGNTQFANILINDNIKNEYCKKYKIKLYRFTIIVEALSFIKSLSPINNKKKKFKHKKRNHKNKYTPPNTEDGEKFLEKHNFIIETMLSSKKSISHIIRYVIEQNLYYKKTWNKPERYEDSSMYAHYRELKIALLHLQNKQLTPT